MCLIAVSFQETPQGAYFSLEFSEAVFHGVLNPLHVRTQNDVSVNGCLESSPILAIPLFRSRLGYGRDRDFSKPSYEASPEYPCQANQ